MAGERKKRKKNWISKGGWGLLSLVVSRWRPWLVQVAGEQGRRGIKPGAAAWLQEGEGKKKIQREPGAGQKKSKNQKGTMGAGWFGSEKKMKPGRGLEQLKLKMGMVWKMGAEGRRWVEKKTKGGGRLVAFFFFFCEGEEEV